MPKCQIFYWFSLSFTVLFPSKNKQTDWRITVVNDLSEENIEIGTVSRYQWINEKLDSIIQDFWNGDSNPLTDLTLFRAIKRRIQLSIPVGIVFPPRKIDVVFFFFLHYLLLYHVLQHLEPKICELLKITRIWYFSYMFTKVIIYFCKNGKQSGTSF